MTIPLFIVSYIQSFQLAEAATCIIFILRLQAGRNPLFAYSGADIGTGTYPGGQVRSLL